MSSIGTFLCDCHIEVAAQQLASRFIQSRSVEHVEIAKQYIAAGDLKERARHAVRIDSPKAPGQELGWR
jgi:hypothetical protein